MTTPAMNMHHPSLHLPTIPQPPRKPLLGNLPQLDPHTPVQGLMKLAKQLGPIYRLDLLGKSLVVLSSQELVNEVCDESRFGKVLQPPVVHVRDLAGDGLFTALSDEPNWARAHRILMPAFGPLGVRSMFGRMYDIAEQMCLRWERLGEHALIDVPDQMTRLTLDTLALCAFDTRFNSFYQNDMHPFVDAMVGALTEAGKRSRRPELLNRLMLPARRRYKDNIRKLHALADQLVADRRAHPRAGGQPDLLDRMLEGHDPETGETLSQDNIRYQLVTFLIAGHETTSGLLSFALHLLLKHPGIMARAQATVDAVLDEDVPRIEHLAGLGYLEQVLMETLRLWPTAPAMALRAREKTTIGGHWPIDTTDTLLVLIPSLHRDAAVWDEPDAFCPERFDPERARLLPPNAWKPFGHGARACIGRPFAMQEATLVLAMLLQRFDLIPADASRELVVKETLTLKPDGLSIRARRRRTQGPARSSLATPAPQTLATPPQAQPSEATDPLWLQHRLQ